MDALQTALVFLWVAASLGLAAMSLKYLQQKQTYQRELETLRQREAQLQLSLAVSQVGTWAWQIDADQVEWNEHHFRLIGYEPGEVEPSYQLWISAIHPDDVARVEAAVETSLRTTTEYTEEYRVHHPDGSIHWLLGRGQGFRNPQGEPVRMLGITLDITERKQAEMALRRNEQSFQSIAANVPGAIFRYVLRREGSDAVIYMNRGCRDLWEVDAEVAAENTQVLWAMVHPDDIDALRQSVKEAAQTLQPWTQQWRITTPSGQVKWLQGAGRPQRHEQGDTVWDTLILDVSERQRAEAINRQILQAIPDLLLWMKADGTCVGLSEGSDIANLFPNPSQPVGVNQYDLLPPDLAQLRRQAIDRALTTGEVQVYEQQLTIGEDTQHEEVRVVQVDTDQVLVIIRNISDRKRSEAQRQQAEQALRESENRYRKVVEAQTDFILRSRPDTTITFANEALCQALGVSLHDIIGRQWSQFANPNDLQQDAFQGIAQLTPDSPRFFAENRDHRANGEIGWTQWLNQGIFDPQGQLVEIQSVGRDITALKWAEQAVRASEERLRLVTENMSDLVCLHHPDGRYLYVTPSSRLLLGYSPEELIDQNPYDMLHPEDQERLQPSSSDCWLTAQQGAITYRLRRQTGDYIWLETITKPILDTTGEVMHLQTTSRDVSDRIQVEKQLRHEVLHDALTGLPNRTLLMERLHLAIKRAQRHPQFQFAVLFLDLDQFKVINDSLGHLVGDQLLMAIAQKLLSLVREADLVARISGDEFVILLEDIDGIQEVVQVATRISADLKSPLMLAGREVFITTSIGIATGTDSYYQPEELVRDADIAMYRAKRSGRANYAIFDPAMHLQVLQRLHLENDLRRALEHEEFLLYYQPIVALKTLQLAGFEVLIRWQHTSLGCMNPSQFISVAEETGLIVPIGAWVLRTACQQLASWRQQFAQARHLKISVNLSVKQLQNTILLPQLEQVLQATGLPGEALNLEITESMLVENVEMTRQLLMQIQAQGIQISIDDFGTGYSSLGYLHQLPVDALKIDRTFVQRGPGATRQTIAESIVTLSNLLGLDAIAEGIETPQQLQWLQKLGCEMGQGYLFSRPVPAAAAHQLLQKLQSNR